PDARAGRVAAVRRLLRRRAEGPHMDISQCASTSRHGVPRVLIVDDELDHAEICAALLRRRGYAVAVAMSGLDALTLASALKPDVILLDLFMPAVDGFST